MYYVEKFMYGKLMFKINPKQDFQAFGSFKTEIFAIIHGNWLSDENCKHEAKKRILELLEKVIK